MNTTERREYELVIVGAGAAGLGLARALLARGVRNFRVFERRSREAAFSGKYAYGLSPAGLQAIYSISPAALETTWRDGYPYQRFNQADYETGAHLSVTLQPPESFPYQRHLRALGIDDRGVLGINIPRATLLKSLFDGLEDFVTFDSPLTAIEERAGVVDVSFGGEHCRAQVVIGADGASSKVRDYVCPRSQVERLPEVVFGQEVVLTEEIRNRCATGEFCIWALGRDAVLMNPISKDVVFLMVGSHHGSARPPSAAELVTRLASRRSHDNLDWLLAHLDPARWEEMPRGTRVKTPRWRRGRVLLIGDAAHAVNPNIGLGAVMSLEDAALFADSYCEMKQDALKVFVAKRSKRVASIQRWDRVNYHLLMFAEGWIGQVFNRTARLAPR